MDLSKDWIIYAATAALIAGFYLRKVLVARKRAGLARAAVTAGGKLVDVRTAGEFAGGHIDGAVNIPLDQLRNRARDLGSKKRAVVVYCQSGARSAQAAGILRASGFDQVIDLGPMWAWKAGR